LNGVTPAPRRGAGGSSGRRCRSRPAPEAAFSGSVSRRRTPRSRAPCHLSHRRRSGPCRARRSRGRPVVGVGFDQVAEGEHDLAAGGQRRRAPVPKASPATATAVVRRPRSRPLPTSAWMSPVAGLKTGSDGRSSRQPRPTIQWSICRMVPGLQRLRLGRAGAVCGCSIRRRLTRHGEGPPPYTPGRP